MRQPNAYRPHPLLNRGEWLFVATMIATLIIGLLVAWPAHAMGVRTAYNQMVKTWHMPGPPLTRHQFRVVVTMTAINGGQDKVKFLEDVRDRTLANPDG